jgi:hypothetical protein
MIAQSAKNLAWYLVSGHCPLTGRWRDRVLAHSEAEAVAMYCDTYGMNPALCEASPVASLNLKTSPLKTSHP